MNFFEAQHQARQHSKRLVLLFVLAVIAIVVAIDLVIFVALIANGDDAAAGLTVSETIAQHTGTLLGSSLLVVGVIALASMFKIGTLRTGGGAVARSLGGTLISAETTNPHHRRLRNVVEEIAIASGVPVPEIYVLEEEAGINAFAAGYTPSDAAVAVTRGALEKLKRDELQGVIAHEFSHILNGDMRLNIRLMGLLFGILVIGLIGRKILEGMRHARDSKGTVPIFVIALAVMIVGYVGVFFGRWIKAGVSRSREFLADASAVQFTRQTTGLAGALKKVGGLPEGSKIENPEVEEVSHMLFGPGMNFSSMFSTHPPLLDRIQRLDKSFRPDQYAAIAKQWSQPVDVLAMDAALGLDQGIGQVVTTAVAEPPPLPDVRRDVAVQPRSVSNQVGTPKQDDFATADTIQNRIPPLLLAAARAQRSADRVVYALLLDDAADIRQQQLAMIVAHCGAEAESETLLMREAVSGLHPMQRMPLAAIAFPALRRHPRPWLNGFVTLLDRLIHADGQHALFEFCLARLVSIHVIEALDPARARVIGRRKLVQCEIETALLFAVLAHAGHDSTVDAQRGFQSGMQLLFGQRSVAMPDSSGWHDSLVPALSTLDQLDSAGKQLLIEAMVTTISHDGHIAVAEAELLRVACAALHCPLPPMLSR
ncbi:MAG TPA: M48 family metallopeptidase [Patescibacteria group bacterium]|nr:M48 family metallopeptidase [Patescibacteria group bacterium]